MSAQLPLDETSEYTSNWDEVEQRYTAKAPRYPSITIISDREEEALDMLVQIVESLRGRWETRRTSQA